MAHHVLVIGGGLAGSRTCVELRKAGHDGPITLLGAEQHLPYDRPPLSKAALHDAVDTTLPDDLGALGVDVRLGHHATALDAGARRVGTEHGDVGYGTLVIATGAEPVRLPGPGSQLTVRTLEDAARLRAALVPGTHVAVVGSGWVGAEVTTAALARGCRVTCVEAADRPLHAAFGPAVAAELAHFWDGVRLRTGVGVTRVDPGRLHLTDGTSTGTDVVVCAVGVRPVVGWAAAAGLAVDRGILVDEHLRSSVDGVFAVGDAAVHWSPRRQRHLHALHWDDAAEAPAALAAAVVGRTDLPYDPVPYFWSDQFGHKLQYAGVHDPADRTVWRRDADGTLLGVGWLDASGVLTAYLTVDRPRDALHARLSIAAGRTPDPDRLADPAVPVRSA